jgi:hypothetical protein
MSPDGCGGAGQTGGAGGTGNMGGAGTTTSTGMGGAGSGTGGAGGAGGGGPTGPVIPCGGELCQPGEICCHNTINSAFDNCDNPGDCDFSFVEIRCAGPGDCMPGQVCCGAWSYGINNWVSAECKPQCNNENPFCGDAPDSCPPGWTCNTPDNLLGSGYGWCSPP